MTESHRAKAKFDEMMGVSGVFTNDAGKQFSSGNYNRKMLV